MTVSRFENSVDLDHSVFHCTCKFLLIKFFNVSYVESTRHGFWLLHFTMDNFTSFFCRLLIFFRN